VEFVMQRFAIAFLCLLPFAASAAPQAEGYDSHGGWLKLKGEKTSFFHTQKIDGRWWLVDPEGNVFFSKGVDNIGYAPEADS